MTLDPDTPPDAAAWLALTQAERIAAAAAAHAGVDDELHASLRGPAHMHHVLHAIVETHAAGGEPPITGETLARLTADGLRRHAAVHMVCEVLVGALATGTIGDAEAWAPRLRALDAGQWLGARMARRFAPDG